MHATTIVGYTYDADNYGPECIAAVLAADGFPVAPGELGHDQAAENMLDELAEIRRIDRMDARSYDSGEFPKVIFASQVEDDSEICGHCLNPLIA